MKKDEYFERYGEEAYEKLLKQNREWYKRHPESAYRADVKDSRKEGKYYERIRKYNRTGIPGKKYNIRIVHAERWREYKNIIAPNSQIHHEWLPGTAKHRGMALVERDQHIHGFIDVIEILEGKITLFTEKEIKGEKKHGIC